MSLEIHAIVHAIHTSVFCATRVAKIQGMKNVVPKNDKKRRKQLTEDVAKLEAELNKKHEEELLQLTDTQVSIQVICEMS